MTSRLATDISQSNRLLPVSIRYRCPCRYPDRDWNDDRSKMMIHCQIFVRNLIGFQMLYRCELCEIKFLLIPNHRNSWGSKNNNNSNNDNNRSKWTTTIPGWEPWNCFDGNSGIFWVRYGRHWWSMFEAGWSRLIDINSQKWTMWARNEKVKVEKQVGYLSVSGRTKIIRQQKFYDFRENLANLLV